MVKFLFTFIIFALSLNLYSQDTLIWKKRVYHLGVVKTIALNDNETLLAHNVNNLIHLRDTSGIFLQDIDFSEANINAIEFSDNNRIFFPTIENTTKAAAIFEWDLNTNEILTLLEPDPLNGYENVLDISISPDKSMLGVVFSFINSQNNELSYRIILWNLNTQTILYNESFSNEAQIDKIIFGDSKIYFDYSKEIAYIDLNSMEMMRPFQNDNLLHKSEIKDFALNSAGDKIASVDFDGECKIWNLATTKIDRSFTPIENATKLSLIEFGKNDDYLIFADNSKKYITKYGLNEQSIINSYISVDSTIFDFKISKDKSVLYFCDGINISKLKLDYRKAISVEENTVENKINLYPNPANDFLNISLAKKESFELIISDLFGNEIYKINSFGKEIKVNTSKLTNGIYFLKLISSNTVYFRKFIKN